MKKTAVITGATDGIGNALAILLSRDYNLALCGRSKDKMDRLIQKLGNCHIYTDCFDITDKEKRHAFCENLKKEFGSVDILVNNAGANTKKDKVVEINLDDLRYMFELNCVSAVGMIQELYPLMAEKQSGLIINILSSCCLFNNPWYATRVFDDSLKSPEDLIEAVCAVTKEDVMRAAQNVSLHTVYSLMPQEGNE